MITELKWYPNFQMLYYLIISLLHFRYLTEEKEINLNVRDIWDSTPL